MAPKTAVNLANLEALGAKRLAEILLELGTQDAALKCRLRLDEGGHRARGQFEHGEPQCANRTGRVVRSRTWRVVPPTSISRRREWP